MVIRVLDQEHVILDLKRLGFPDYLLDKFSRLIQKPYGLILVTGPTGSGKTTTLYSVLKHLSRPEVNIITIEDPIEMVFEDFNQVQVRPQIEVTFASTLLLDIEFAVYVGAVISIALHLAATSHPRIYSTLPDLISGKMVPAAYGRMCCQMDIVRVEGSIFFGSATFVLEDLQRRTKDFLPLVAGKHLELKRGVRLVVDAHSTSFPHSRSQTADCRLQTILWHDARRCP